MDRNSVRELYDGGVSSGGIAEKGVIIGFLLGGITSLE